MNRKREKWIDGVKILACILVATGHFLQSMVTAGLMPKTGCYDWFMDAIYYFHVPLFFIASGYLYQKKGDVLSFGAWKRNILRKALVLGIPYFSFSLITWILKEALSGSVNHLNRGLLETLFLEPSSPYWFLYSLFFIFAVTPAFSGKRGAITGLVVAVILKFINLYMGDTGVYCFSTVLANEVWFVIGMTICILDIPSVCRSGKWLFVGICVALLFLTGSVLIHVSDWHPAAESFVMGVAGCAAVILIMVNLCTDGKNRRLAENVIKYTMPVFLMHTIFAAGVRSVLLKLGMANLSIHLLLGLTASFLGPIIAAEIMQRLKLDVMIYPERYIRISK